MQAISLIKAKLNNETFLSYLEIAAITGYHPKYISKLKKEILDGTVTTVHGNKNRKPANALTPYEEQKIVDLYRRSNASIRKFCKFYHTRSYSCIYNVLKKHGLIKEK